MTSERLRQSGGNVLNNQNDPIGQQNGEFQRVAKRNHRLFGVMLIIYFAVALLIGLLDLGEPHLAMTFSTIVENVIPSIAGTAALSPHPNSARLILSISWSYIAIFYFVFLFRVPWGLIEWNNLKRPILTIFVGIVVFFLFFLGLSESVPSLESARIGRAIYVGVKSSILFMPIWGGVIILTIFPAALVVTLYFVCCVNKYLNK